MLLKFVNQEGRQVEVELGNQVITIGRAANADISIPDAKMSRFHCGIRCWDGEYVAKDLKSRNGTFLNEQRVDVAVLKIGDRLRVGSTVFHCEARASKGAGTILRELGDEMDEGKGYKTILREIVRSADDKPPTEGEAGAKPGKKGGGKAD